MKHQIQIPLVLLALCQILGGCTSLAPVEAVVEEKPAAKVQCHGQGAEDDRCVEAQTVPKARPKPREYPVAPFKNDSLYQLLVAEVAGYRGEYETALEKYMQMAEETRDAGVAARATRLANYIKRNDLALKAAQIWAEVEPDSIEAHQHSADQLMRAGDLERAVYHMEAVKNLGGLAKFDVFAYRAANLDSESRDSLLDAISALLERHPGDEEIIFAKAVLLEQKGEFEAALELANQLLKTRQNNNVVILKVNALRNLHRTDDAIEFLKKTIAGLDGESRRLRLVLARFLFEAGKLDDARVQYENVLDQAPGDVDILFALALIEMELDNDGIAAGYLRKMIRFNRRAGEAHYYLGSIEERRGDADAALWEYRRVGRGYEFLPAQARIANILFDKNRIREMHDYLANMRSQNPERFGQLVLIEGQLLSEHGMSEAVFDLMDEVIKDRADDVDLLYFRAMTGQKFGRIDVLERDLRSIIELDPDNSDAMNALGYTLADQTSRFDEALALIKQALSMKPDEAAFIDSMGWVLYRLKNFNEAITYLRRALELFTNDEVAAHLGEVLWTIGETVEARQVWKTALDLKPDSEILIKVIKEFTAL